VAMGQPIRRSVDSQVKGRVIDPRELTLQRAVVLDLRGGRFQAPDRWPTQPACLILPGSPE
jgi:hypothetical protein